MTKLTLFFHIMLVIITALLCLDVRKKDKNTIYSMFRHNDLLDCINCE